MTSQEEAPSNNASSLGLPFFGKPFEQESDLHTAEDWLASPLTVRERSMLSLMLALKDKPEWDRKVFDEEIVSRWRKEALQFNPDQEYEETGEGQDPDEENLEHNGASPNVDGEARQKTVSGQMFDCVCSPSRSC